MPVIKGRSWWWNKLRKELFDVHKITRGSINLSYCRHEVFIAIPADLKIHVKCIYLCCHGEGDPVCQGDIDLCGHEEIEGGFVIYADIRHNVSNIDWLVEYDIDDDTDPD